MVFTEFIPGMKPGSTVRNIIVGFVYLLFFYLIPFVLAYAVFTNRSGIADKLSGIPGIAEGGGVVSALAIFLISIVVIGVITAALPSEEAPGTGEVPSTDGAPTGTDDTPDSEDGGQSEPSPDEQQQQVEETDETDTEGSGANAAESDVEERDFSDDELIPLFETLVEDEGMIVETAQVQRDTFVVEYMSFAQTEQELAGEIGYVAGAYAGMVGEGHTSDRMEATILTVNGDPAGTFYVEYGWAEAFANEEISNTEFSQRVISTIESEDEGQASIQGGSNLAATESA
ncbi:DUF3488 domain-containing protein [Halalkalicoccus sp. NIPERK01]|uniref:DUF3488 domain-containing protein n=1 Tax=Halalkalicoccus sp. NIPERK01 TaxID=3053469 RepID=UPI00256F024C|nr:hypothetical protein [Halalkalicoccus sp. NIPERK01]MDL5363899.1 hypothetical protein [Halalkalicoccus sp. NIPERK01]